MAAVLPLPDVGEMPATGRTTARGGRLQRAATLRALTLLPVDGRHDGVPAPGGLQLLLPVDGRHDGVPALGGLQLLLPVDGRHDGVPALGGLVGAGGCRG